MIMFESNPSDLARLDQRFARIDQQQRDVKKRASERVSRLSDRLANRRMPMMDIADVVCAIFGVPVEEVLGDDLKRYITIPRQALMYLLAARWSLTRVAAFFSPYRARPMDHTTVLHGRDRTMERMDECLRRAGFR